MKLRLGRNRHSRTDLLKRIYVEVVIEFAATSSSRSGEHVIGFGSDLDSTSYLHRSHSADDAGVCCFATERRWMFPGRMKMHPVGIHN